MKKLLVLIFLFLYLFCNAQNDWAPVGAKWWYEAVDIPLFGPPPYAVWYYTTEVVNDTIIQGKNCRQITTNVCSICPYSCYIYSDSNKVFYYNYVLDTFFLLYNMNLAPGQDWNIYYNSPWGGELDSVKVSVTDTFSTDINGVPFKTQQIESTSDNLEFGYEIINKIGNTFSFFPIDYGACDAGFGYLRCYVDSTNEIYAHFSDCEYTDVGINENDDEISLDISPNPASEILNIELQENRSYDLTLTDLQGKVVYASLLDYPSTSSGQAGDKYAIDVSGFANGIYLLTLQNEEQRTTVKVVVQH